MIVLSVRGRGNGAEFNLPSHLTAQDACSDARRRYADDVLSFSPWCALEAHCPLASVMRSRRATYPMWSEFRHTVNGITPQEPSSIEELPA